MFLTQCLVVIVIAIIICFRHCLNVYSRALTIPSEVQAVQDVIHPLMNHTLTSDHLFGPMLLGHLELRLDLFPLGFVTKPTAYQ